MTESLSNPRETIADIAASIYAECRNNVELYDSPSGFGTDVGGVNWNVCYWPAYADANGKHLDSVQVMRDFETYQNPCSYFIKHNGTISKNEKIAKRMPGGVYYDPAGEVLVQDSTTADLLRAIVRTVHSVRRGSLD